MEKETVKKYDFSSIIEDKNKKLVLIIYDISDDKRRLNIVKLLESYGKRVQKSAFEALLNQEQYRELIPKVIRLIGICDNVRLYRLNSSNEVVLLGESDTIYEENIIII